MTNNYKINVGTFNRTGNQYYTVSDRCEKIDIHFPVEWLKEDEKNDAGILHCPNCKVYGNLNGVFIGYCMNCAEHVYGFERGFGMVESGVERTVEDIYLSGSRMITTDSPYFDNQELFESRSIWKSYMDDHWGFPKSIEDMKSDIGDVLYEKKVVEEKEDETIYRCYANDENDNFDNVHSLNLGLANYSDEDEEKFSDMCDKYEGQGRNQKKIM